MVELHGDNVYMSLYGNSKGEVLVLIEDVVELLKLMKDNPQILERIDPMSFYRTDEEKN